MEKLYQDKNYLSYLYEFITPNRREGFERVLANRTRHITIAIEDVYQLHNTSAVMRSCEVFGVQDLHVIEERFGKRIDKEIAMGAEKWVDIHRYQNANQCIDTLREKGYQIVITSPHIDANYLQDFDVSKKSAIFFGTEKNGLSQEIMNQADAKIKIPMVGFTESLNISVSAAIVIQDLMNRLRQTSIDWKLTEEELLEKRIDWTRKSIKDIDFITERYLQLQHQE